jgi:hypothetical protein
LGESCYRDGGVQNWTLGYCPATHSAPTPLVSMILIYSKPDQVFPLSLRLLPRCAENLN